MTDSADPGRGEAPGSAGRPPDPGEDRPGDPGEPQEATGTEGKTVYSQDSVVPETQDSQVEGDQLTPQGSAEAAASSPSPDESQGSNTAASEEAPSTEATTMPASTPQVQRGQRTATEKSSTGPAVGPEEMFDAVVAAMKAAPQEQPRNEWTETVAALYKMVHATVAYDEDLVPTSKSRYPKLRGDEKAWLCTLFQEACVLSDGSYVEWGRLATAVTQDLYNTSWSFVHIVQTLISRVKWAHATPLNQWAEKVKKGTKAEQGQAQAPESRAQAGYTPFMFNPAVYSKEEIAGMRKLCEQPPAAKTGRRLGEGTKEEWKVIAGMVEGSIVCRRSPGFLKSVLDSKECIRLYGTIQKQVEGELVLQLRGWIKIKKSRQSTRAIKDDILAAAVNQGMNQADIRQLLHLAKTISYNHVHRSIHFHMFDRATAIKFQDTQIPFRKAVYRLRNAHRPDSGSIWARQLGRDGVRMETQREYEVDIFNVTRFTDVGRLNAYLQVHIKADIEFEAMDTCTPESDTSTVWRLTMKTAECPEFLRGIVRLMWYGRSLVLKHPAVRHRLQCLQCGNVGHTMARCQYTDEQLKGEGSRVAHDSEVARLEDMAKPFASLDEIRKSAATRLSLQQEVDRKNQAAVAPSAEQPSPPTSREQRAESSHSPRMDPNGAGKSASGPPEPKPPRKWVTVPQAHGRKLYAHQATLQQRQVGAPSRFAELFDDSEDDENQEEKRPVPQHQPVIEISSGDENEVNKPAPITAEAKKLLHLITAKPPKQIDSPQLVALKQRERDEIQLALATIADFKGPRLPGTRDTGKGITSFAEIEELLGMREVTTPSTGNCMAMALAQAIADHDLAAHGECLESLTTSLKKGIKWTALMNCTEQFNHFARTTTLINVGRGWEGMDARESGKQFRWFLHEYAESSSDRQETIPRHVWGCSELMATAANFLQRQIYVLAYNTDKTEQWYCSKYRPSTISRGRKLFNTGQQIPLQVGRCLAEIKKAKQRNKVPPLVVRYWGEHYSAFVHSGPTSLPTQAPAAGETKQTSQPVQADVGGLGKSVHAASSQGKEADLNPWNPSQWNGNIEDLRERLTGMTIPHDLKCEIHLILERAEPDRYAELLAFLVNTASQLSLEERATLLKLDLTHEASEDVRQWLQFYQVSIEVLRQWQRSAAETEREEEQAQVDPEPTTEEDSDQAYEPLSMSSVASSQSAESATLRLTRSQTASQKRPHSITPTEGEQIRILMRVKRSTQTAEDVPEAMQDVAQLPPTQEQAITRDAWPELWQQLGSTWPATATMTFPRDTRSAQQWSEAARGEPARLLRLLQRFPFPDEVLVSIDDPVLEDWTAAWRLECLSGQLGVYRTKTTDRSTQRWIKDWRNKISRPTPPNTVPAVDSPEDWARLRGNGYGKDEILKMCDVGNKLRLAQHILCALLYEREIRALMGQESDGDQGVRSRLARHLQALRQLESYKTAYAADARRVDWFRVARYFAQALEHGGPDPILRND